MVQAPLSILLTSALFCGMSLVGGACYYNGGLETRQASRTLDTPTRTSKDNLDDGSLCVGGSGCVKDLFFP